MVTLSPGESRTLAIDLPRRAFEHWTPEGWAIEPGEFTLQVDTSVMELPHTAQLS